MTLGKSFEALLAGCVFCLGAAVPALSQQTGGTTAVATATDGGGHGAGRGRGAGGAGGGHTDDGGHTGDDGHTDDGGHTGDDGHTEDGHDGGHQGNGPQYHGGRNVAVSGVGHGRSVEDRVLRAEPF